MDPDVTYEELQANAAALITVIDETLDDEQPDFEPQVVNDMAEGFQNLDQWLSRGGFPPIAWKMPTDSNDVIAAVRGGALDTRFDELVEAMKARRVFLDAQAALRLTPGSRVKADQTLTPKHRRGKLATVLPDACKPGYVVLQFDDRPSQKWTWPASHLIVQATPDTAPV